MEEPGRSSHSIHRPLLGGHWKSLACEVFVLVFATTAGPKPDPSHAFEIGVSPSKVLRGDTIGKHQETIETPPNSNLRFVLETCDSQRKHVICMFRKSIIDMFYIIFEFD